MIIKKQKGTQNYQIDTKWSYGDMQNVLRGMKNYNNHKEKHAFLSLRLHQSGGLAPMYMGWGPFTCLWVGARCLMQWKKCVW